MSDLFQQLAPLDWVRSLGDWTQSLLRSSGPTPTETTHANPFSQLPPELIILILEAVINASDRGTRSTQAVRHILSSCSLTCKVWAHYARPLLFENIVLRSHSDVHILVAMVDGTLPQLGSWIQILEIADTGNPYSWAHIALRCLHRRLPSVQVLRFHRSTGETTQGIQLIPSLPSTDILVPLRCGFEGLVKLGFENTRFPYFRSLLQLVGALKNLQELHAIGLIYDLDVPFTAEQLVSIPFRPTLRSITLCDCLVDPWQMLWLFACFRNKRSSPGLLNPSEMETVVGLGRSLVGVRMWQTTLHFMRRNSTY